MGRYLYWKLMLFNQHHKKKVSNTWGTSHLENPTFPGKRLETLFPRLPFSQGQGQWPVLGWWDVPVTQKTVEKCRRCHVEFRMVKRLFQEQQCRQGTCWQPTLSIGGQGVQTARHALRAVQGTPTQGNWVAVPSHLAYKLHILALLEFQ